MNVRLFHRGARIVIVFRRTAPGQERWWAPRIRSADWVRILAGELRLLGLPSEPDGPAALTCRLGRIDWTTTRGWSIITLQLTGGSETKRRLVSAALLKAARYARQPRWARCPGTVEKESRWPA